MKRARSGALYRRAQRVMPGGVSSPVRSFSSVGGHPFFVASGKGSLLWDVDGNSYIDYVLSWGPLIVGHAHPVVGRAIEGAAKKGTSFGAPTEVELRLAETIMSSLPSIEMLRFVNSGTEATMSAIRLARGFTRRERVLKFDGCYHGHADPFLSVAGSGLATLGISSSAGVPANVARDMVTTPFNDLDVLEAAFRKHGHELAAVIVEPIAGNMGVVPPERGFLEGVRRLCTDNGSILIFDEVITGFRVARQGAQGLYGIRPDLTCLGKIIGGGFPVGAYGGRKEIMSLVAPVGPVYQAGTLSGNPVAMTAGLATLDILDSSAYAKLEERSKTLVAAFLEASAISSIPVIINRIGSMVGLFFGSDPVRNFEQVKKTKHERYPRFHRSMLQNGSYLPPSAFETIFVSTAHRERDIERTFDAAKIAFRECRA